MKRLYYFAAAMAFVACCAGCSFNELVQDEPTAGEPVIIHAYRADEDAAGPATRTMRDENGKFYWCRGDEISIFYGHGTAGGSRFVSMQEADTVRVTDFSGNISVIAGGANISVEDTYFWGLYPYDPAAECDGTSVTTTLPSEQEAVAGTFANNLFPSLGHSRGLMMGFYNVCGGFRFSLQKEGVKKVTFRGKNHEKLTGRIRISMAGGVPSTEILEGEEEVVLSAPAGTTFEPGQLYYFVLVPTELTSGFTVTIETPTEEASFLYDDPITIERSRFRSKKQMDEGLTYTRKTGSIPVEDPVFKAYLVANFDTDQDGEISYEEAGNIDFIQVHNSQITSLQGIEYMPELYYLDCSGCQLTSLDISHNTALYSLYCNYNQLSSLNVSNNAALHELYCSNNQLISLDLTTNSSLSWIECYNNQLVSLDVSNNTVLTHLHCFNNQLTSLNVTNCSALTSLCCNNNQLTSLDLSTNHSLSEIQIEENDQLASLDVSNCTSLTELNCSSRQLTSLNVANCSALSSLNCSNNQLTSLDVTTCSALGVLVCNDNLLVSLDVSYNLNLGDLQCNNNLISRLDVSHNTALFSLNCIQMPYEPYNSNRLHILYVNEGQLSSIVSGNNEIINGVETIRVRPCGDSSSVFVDMGLPSGIKWADFDIPGGYYSWGEVASKGRYSSFVYEWWGEDSDPYGESPINLKYNTDSRFGIVDNKTILDLEDDVAHDVLGGNWRMPTYDEFLELIENCDWAWVSGTMIVTSRINGNSISFSPRSGNYGMDEMSYYDGFARFWSSSLDADHPGHAWRLTVRSEGWLDEEDELVYMAHDIRAAGFAIRPVYDPE